MRSPVSTHPTLLQIRSSLPIMQLSNRTASKPASASRASAARPRTRMVTCNFSEGATAWESWDSYMKRRTAVVQPNAEEKKFSSAIGDAIKSCAAGYKPHFAALASQQLEPVYKPVKNVVPLSADLHEKLEAMGLVYLKQALGLKPDAAFEAVGTSFTTTDVNAGVTVTGAIVQRETGKEAVVAFVATETERQASWSRLEGLLLHWACSSEQGGAWCMPPVGWKALLPGKKADAGGAMQCGFEKHTEGQQQMYVLVMSLPLSGILRTGGITFVLKASDAQNTKWLKDETNGKDFFIDLHNLPYSKI